MFHFSFCVPDWHDSSISGSRLPKGFFIDQDFESTNEDESEDLDLTKEQDEEEEEEDYEEEEEEEDEEEELNEKFGASALDEDVWRPRGLTFLIVWCMRVESSFGWCVFAVWL